MLRQLVSRFRSLPLWARVLAGLLAVGIVAAPFTGGASRVRENTVRESTASRPPTTAGSAPSTSVGTAPLPAAVDSTVSPPTVVATTAAPAPPRTTPPVTGRPGQCHPSYVGACLPVAADVDCAGEGDGPAYVAEKFFEVVGPDVYDLDPEGDGRACGD